ncbi:MAG: hypothetical protein ACM3U0_00055 [archaeon]
MQGHLVILSFALLVLLIIAMSYAGIMIFKSDMILRHHPHLGHRHHHYQKNNRDFNRTYKMNGSE